MKPLYYPLLRSGTIGVQQPQFAPMYRNLMLMVADINVGQDEDNSLYIVSDDLPMLLTNKNGITVATVSQVLSDKGKMEFKFTSHVCNIRDRANKYGLKDAVISANPQYIVTAVKEQLKKMLIAARQIEFEVFRSELSYFGYSLSTDVRTKFNTTSTSIVTTFSGAFWYEINEVLQGRLALADMEPEHLASYKAMLDKNDNVISGSKHAFDRQKTMLGTEKWLVLRQRYGLQIGAYSVSKIDGMGGVRSTTDIMLVEPMRLYADMDMVRQHCPEAYADITLALADAAAFAHANGLGHRVRGDKEVGLNSLPTDTLEEVGYCYTRKGSEYYNLLLDKRS